MSSDILRIKKKKEKKLRRDASLLISSPLALGLKYLTTESAARAASYESAILLRAIKPNTTTLPMVLKNDKLLKWDAVLVLNSVKKMFSHQTKHFKHHNMKNKASSLKSMSSNIKDMMIEDLMLMSPLAMYAVMTAFWTQDPTGLKIQKHYVAQRPSFTTDPNNRIRNLANLSGLCIGYNFKLEGCNITDCPYGHYCAFHPTEQLQHPSMRCTQNHNLWKKRNYNNNNRRGRGRGRNNYNHRNNQYHNNRYNQYQNNYHYPAYSQQPPYPQYPPPQQYPPCDPNQCPPNQFPPAPPNNNPRGNKDRFFKGPK